MDVNSDSLGISSGTNLMLRKSRTLEEAWQIIERANLDGTLDSLGLGSDIKSIQEIVFLQNGTYVSLGWHAQLSNETGDL